MTDHADELAGFISGAPTPYHAVAAAADRLRGAGYAEVGDFARWRVTPGGHFFVRDGTLLAWSVPVRPRTGTPARPVRVFAAHTDSPTLKIKPRPDTGAAGWRQLGVEIYGGALWNSWLDRDLGVAGRLVTYAGETVLVNLNRPLLRIPQLAIHLDRQVNSAGLSLDPDRQLTPVWGLGDPTPGEFLTFIAAEAGVDPAEVAAHDLVLHDVHPPARIGRHRELLAAPRLDNLASVYAGVQALLGAAASDEVIPVLACFDHEEVGSGTATGASGPLLDIVLAALAGGSDERQALVATARGLSVDVTHAVHPNYLERHDPEHRALPNGGPTLKFNANQHYATEAPGAAAWRRACRAAGVPTQVFLSRNGVPCGTTVGPLIATRLGIRTVDVGIPVLSMHSSRELCGADDPGRLIAAATAFLTDPV